MKDPMNRTIASRWKGLRNLRMAEKLTARECIDLSHCERTNTEPNQYYILDEFVEGIDYCNADTEQWIWSIGRNKMTGEIWASHDSIFYQNSTFECIWLR